MATKFYNDFCEAVKGLTIPQIRDLKRSDLAALMSQPTIQSMQPVRFTTMKRKAISGRRRALAQAKTLEVEQILTDTGALAQIQVLYPDAKITPGSGDFVRIRLTKQETEGGN